MNPRIFCFVIRSWEPDRNNALNTLQMLRDIEANEYGAEWVVVVDLSDKEAPKHTVLSIEDACFAFDVVYEVYSS